MPITKPTRTDNGTTVAYHRPTWLEVDLQNNLATVTVNSHSDEAAALAGLPLAWQWRIDVPVELLAGDEPTILAEVERILITDANSPFVDGTIAADSTQALGDLKTRAITKTYRDVDKVYRDALGERQVEYQVAESAARAFAAGGFEGVADDDVHSYALDNPTGEVQTDQWAAEQIIGRADAFHAAQKAMRSVRFKQQAAMRAAATPDDLGTAAAAWDSFIAELRVQLGL